MAAAADGEIFAVAPAVGDFGNLVAIRHVDGYVTLYAHLDTFAKLKVGQQVARGTVVGTVGNTGNAKTVGTHLHFEVRVDNGLRTLEKGNRTVDPIAWMNSAIQNSAVVLHRAIFTGTEQKEISCAGIGIPRPGGVSEVSMFSAAFFICRHLVGRIHSRALKSGRGRRGGATTMRVQAARALVT